MYSRPNETFVTAMQSIGDFFEKKQQQLQHQKISDMNRKNQDINAIEKKRIEKRIVSNI